MDFEPISHKTSPVPLTLVMKVCKKCGETKRLEEFYPNKEVKDGREGACKECRIKRMKERSQEPEVKVRVRKRARTSEAKAQKKIYMKEYNQRPEVKDRDKERHRSPAGKAQTRKRRKERYINDSVYRFTCCMRARINLGLKGYSKSKRTEWFLSCTFGEAMDFLEKKFRPPMTRANMGEVWEVDHIRPICSFDLSDPEQVKVCFHYTNLQPLFIGENRSKGGKY